MSEIQARAKVRITLEISLSQPWGGECSIDQVYRQAASNARDEINKIREELPTFFIIGEPEIIGIITERK